MSIVLIDATDDSLTVSWTGCTGRAYDTNQQKKNCYYVLQYRVATSSTAAMHESDNNNDENNNSSEYVTLSDSLRTTQARKKNLIDPNRNGYCFRVSSSTTSNSSGPSQYNGREWITHTEPFHLLTVEQESERMVAAQVHYGGSNASLLISWTIPSFIVSTDIGNSSTGSNIDVGEQNAGNNFPPIITYEIQMRENFGGVPWTTVATSFLGTEVRKNNLTSLHGYQFRIRPIVTPSTSSIAHTYYFSPPSDPVVALSYSNSGIQHLFRSLQDNMLLSNHSHKNNNMTKSLAKLNSPTKIPIADILGGKEFVLLYVSAHWCGPCRQYTPKLISWYINQQKQPPIASSSSSSKSIHNYSPIEVVFVSADHDIESFNSYHQTMPWAAIPYEDTTREELMSLLRVSGIPRLVVYDSRNGKIVDNNATGKSLDIKQWRKIVVK
jgi:thiol-disulfide isomerase/thioredoxin